MTEKKQTWEDTIYFFFFGLGEVSWRIILYQLLGRSPLHFESGSLDFFFFLLCFGMIRSTGGDYE